MQIQRILSVILLLFIVSSVAVLAVRKVREASEAASGGGAIAPEKPALKPAPAEEPRPGEPKLSAGVKVIVYYFHGNSRCPTCKTIEAHAHEAVKTGFAEEMQSGRIEWRVLNFEEKANEGLAKQYQIVAPGVVLVRMEGDRQTRWDNLSDVWSLTGDKAALVAYVQANVRAFLESSDG